MIVLKPVPSASLRSFLLLFFSVSLLVVAATGDSVPASASSSYQQPVAFDRVSELVESRESVGCATELESDATGDERDVRPVPLSPSQRVASGSLRQPVPLVPRAGIEPTGDAQLGGLSGRMCKAAGIASLRAAVSRRHSMLSVPASGSPTLVMLSVRLQN
jgi:hypothetical protein